MKNRRTAPLLIAFLLAAFVAFVASSSQHLPDRVATHFDLNGNPNGWMTRAQHLKFTLAVGVGTPALILGVFALVTKLGGRGLNIPHKAYWLAPEHRQATFEFLQRHSYWLAGMLVAFHAGLFESLLVANARTPVFLSSDHLLWLVGAFLVLLAVWIAILFMRFRRPTS